MHVCISAPTAAHVAISHPRALFFVFPSRCIDCSAASRSSDSPTRKSTLTLKPEKTFEEPNCLLTRAHSGGVRRQSSLPRLSSASSGTRKAAGTLLPTCSWRMPSSTLALACSWSGTSAQAHRAHRHLRHKEGAPRSARETSGREVRFLSPNGRGGAGRWRQPPSTAQMLVPIVSPLSASCHKAYLGVLGLFSNQFRCVTKRRRNSGPTPGPAGLAT